MGGQQGDPVQGQVGLHHREARGEHLGQVEAGLRDGGERRQRGVGPRSPFGGAALGVRAGDPSRRHQSADEAGEQERGRGQPDAQRHRAARRDDLDVPAQGDRLAERDVVPRGVGGHVVECLGRTDPRRRAEDRERAAVSDRRRSRPTSAASGRSRPGSPAVRRHVAAPGGSYVAVTTTPPSRSSRTGFPVSRASAATSGDGPLASVRRDVSGAGQALRRRPGLLLTQRLDHRGHHARDELARVALVDQVEACLRLDQDHDGSADAEDGDQQGGEIAGPGWTWVAHGRDTAARRAVRLPLARNGTPIASARAVSSALR